MPNWSLTKTLRQYLAASTSFAWSRHPFRQVKIMTEVLIRLERVFQAFLGVERLSQAATTVLQVRVQDPKLDTNPSLRGINKARLIGWPCSPEA